MTTGRSVNSDGHGNEKRATTYDLELNPLPIQLDCANLEVDADGGNERRGPSIVAETEQQTRLADTCSIYEFGMVVASSLCTDQSRR